MIDIHANEKVRGTALAAGISEQPAASAVPLTSTVALSEEEYTS